MFGIECNYYIAEVEYREGEEEEDEEEEEVRTLLVVLAKLLLLKSQASQAQREHGQQKYKDLYGNPDKKLKTISILKKFSIKKPNLIANVGNVLPVWLFS